MVLEEKENRHYPAITLSVGSRVMMMMLMIFRSPESLGAIDDFVEAIDCTKGLEQLESAVWNLLYIIFASCCTNGMLRSQ